MPPIHLPLRRAAPSLSRVRSLIISLPIRICSAADGHTSKWRHRVPRNAILNRRSEKNICATRLGFVAGLRVTFSSHERNPLSRPPSGPSCIRQDSQVQGGARIGHNKHMPSPKAKPQKLQCPFCSTISVRGTGLSSHVRTQHPREYVKWNRNPNRLVEAAVSASAKNAPERSRPFRTVPPPSVDVTAETVQPQEEPTTVPATRLGDSNKDVNNAHDLLQRAYEHLRTRKQTIEIELARI